MLPNDRAKIKNEAPEPLAEGLYNLEVVDIAEQVDVETKWGVKDFLLVYSAVLDGEVRGKILTRRISRSYTAGFEGGNSSHLWELACAVKKDILDDTEPFDINELIGGIYRGKVVHNKDAKGRVWANVVKVAEAAAGAKKLDDGEKQYARDLVAGFEDRRAEQQVKPFPVSKEPVEPEEVKA